MAKAGLTQTVIADALDVSKEAVSQWLNDKSFPRPNKLLHLGKLLKLSLDQLVIKVLPFKQNKNDLVRVYREALLSNHYLTIAPINDQILISAANICGQSGLKLPDAIHAATALTHQCSVMLTNDFGFNRVSGINLFLLKDWIGSN